MRLRWPRIAQGNLLGATSLRHALLAIWCGATIAGCAAPGAVPAHEQRTVEGVLTLVYGDPQPPAAQGSVLVSVTEPGGRTYHVLPDSSARFAAGELRRFDRSWVRVVGRFLPGDTLILWISSIDSIAPRRTP